MKFFTLQKLKAWGKAQEKGYLTGDINYIDTEWFIHLVRTPVTLVMG